MHLGHSSNDFHMYVDVNVVSRTCWSSNYRHVIIGGKERLLTEVASVTRNSTAKAAEASASQRCPLNFVRPLKQPRAFTLWNRKKFSCFALALFVSPAAAYCCQKINILQQWTKIWGLYWISCGLTFGNEDWHWKIDRAGQFLEFFISLEQVLILSL